MRRAFFIAGPLLTALLLSANVFGTTWIRLSMTERVAGADLIVVGKLSDVVERDFSLTYGSRDGRMTSSTKYYDRGTIANPKVLKGTPPRFIDLYVAFQSKKQGKRMRLPHATYHSAGEEGIWFLTEDKAMTGHYFVIGPENPLPLSSEDEVRAALKNIAGK